jgi:hypothetical protein
MWVAACCLSHNLPLATLNLKDYEDFRQYHGLPILGPTDQPQPDISGVILWPETKLPANFQVRPLTPQNQWRS